MIAQYFAQINEQNMVTDIAVVHREFLEANPDRYQGRWVETFYDTEGKTYAGIGMIYDETTKNFYIPYTPPEE
ncbi:hypothetical protein uvFWCGRAMDCOMC493_031 [Freshwater phage uvFW-CGR-AMD-COM-C493]|nr:hypothetical protein uvFWCGRAMDCOMC493_031 [Freshwater phage uvFW-CGR-AMD-COM-C493]